MAGKRFVYLLTDKNDKPLGVFSSLTNAVNAGIVEAETYTAKWIIDYLPENAFEGVRPDGCIIRLRRTYEMVATVTQYEVNRSNTYA